MRRFLSNVDFSVLVDVISNVAGMMMMIACIALLVQQQDEGSASTAERVQAKPISFPLAYIPDKRSVTICLKNRQLYTLPETELMLAVEEKTVQGEAIESVGVTLNGVKARADVTRTATGFRFLYAMQETGGVPLNDAAGVAGTLSGLIQRYPPSKFFVVIHCWPDAYPELREIREFLQEAGMEVGWQQRVYTNQEFDIYQAIGEYSEDLSAIKAQ